MLRLTEIQKGQSLVGLEPGIVATVVAVTHLTDNATEVVYKTPEGKLKDRLLNRGDEASIAIATTERPWAFDGKGEDFQLACEAKRIELAFLFDPMMAVHTSNVQPLPHQITAVYESMLPRQPLRYVLADDPGAGKTVMAGLYIRELILRADSRRVLIVSPGSLVEQWRDELFEKFGLDFRIYSSLLEQASASGNPFEEHNQLIVRLDQMSRNEALQEKLCAAGWDLVVFDEAHKLAAHYYGSKIETTGRFLFAQKIGARTRHLLLMTATPHNGKEEDFQLFLSLLDSDRFIGKFRTAAQKPDVSDLMRRMVKEELVKFDGTPLFPERRAYTVNYTLSALERTLYENVTKYVQDEMGKADQLHGARKGSVGFALTTLQRRLASSPEAAYQSLKRRRERLEERLQRTKYGKEALVGTLDPVPDDDDDLSADEQEALEEALVDQASAAKTVAELEKEIVLLRDLEQEAHKVVASGQDRKWDELSKLLQHNPEVLDATGRLRKLIIFTEHRDTLNYLQRRITTVIGDEKAVATIHGGTAREARRDTQERFWTDADVRVLIATDAAGEGVNLQCAHLMVNYDLPWNPNRLEQRFGRVHRINQTEVCHLWSLVAKETREGAVYHRLLEKLQVESEALKGRVFDILGEVFEDTSLKQLLVEAIRYGNQPETRAKLSQQIDSALDPTHIKSLLDRNALAHETMSADRLFAVREEMERAEARRLQPYFVRAFFLKAFDTLGGSIYPREAGRYEITHVPQAVRARPAAARNPRDRDPVQPKYERVCFTKEAIRPADKPGVAAARLIHPGHPLMLAVTDTILEQHANLLRRGTVLADPADDTDTAWLLFLLTHEVKDAAGAVASKRLQFVRVNPDGSSEFAGWAPHLDLEPVSDPDRALLKDVLSASWLTADQEGRAVALAAGSLVPQHFDEVNTQRVQQVDKTLAAVHERLTNEIKYLTGRWEKLRAETGPKRDELNILNIERDINDLTHRLELRKKELLAARHVVSGTPVVLGGALVVPGGLLRKLRGEGSALTAADAAARARVERLAMKAVWDAETARGHKCVDVSKDKCGWDITAYPPAAAGGGTPPARHIEVKGRVKGATTITVTRNEILYAFNQGDKFVLAVVFVNPDDSVEGPHYLRNPFQREPDWGAASVNYTLSELLKRAERA